VDGVGHPTVKPLTLMRWLCRLVTPPGGLILDPFAGSGATLQAGMLEGFRVIGIESDPHSVALIRQRLSQMPDDALPFDDDGEVVA
jgi:DNA modification methylase